MALKATGLPLNQLSSTFLAGTGQMLVPSGRGPDITINAQTGTSYTLVAADNGAVVTLNNGSAITLTVPAGLGVGFNCLLVQLGAGTVTITASGTTVNSRGALLALNGQYAVASLVAYVANTFVAAGDLS